MADYTDFEAANAALNSKTAVASLSIADANYGGIKHHDSSQLQSGDVCMTYIVALFALSSLGTALTAMYLEASILIYVCFACPLILAPVVVCQRSQIQRLPTFREEHDKLRLSVNDWVAETSNLESEVSRLQRQINRLSVVEHRFAELCSRERKDVNVMRELVKEHSTVQDEMKKLQAADELQELVSAILNADRDCDYMLKEKELDEVMIRMRVFAGRNGSNFDEEAIRAAFKGSLTRKGSSLIRIHSAISGNESQQSQSKISRPVQSLQKLPKDDTNEKLLDDTTQKIPTVTNGCSVPTVLPTGLVTTSIPETDGTEVRSMSLLHDTEKSGTDPSGHQSSSSDNPAPRNLLIREESDDVEDNKDGIGNLQWFFVGTDVADPNR